MKRISKSFLLICVLLLSTQSCDSTEKPTPQKQPPKQHPLVFENIKNGVQYNLGANIPITIAVKNNELVGDSVSLYWDDEIIFKAPLKELLEYDLKTSDFILGQHTIKIISKNKNGKTVGDTRSVILFSSTEPLQLKAKIVNKYPHKNTSYTQGLEFHGKDLWEGTGTYGKSFIAKTNLFTGEHSQVKNLDNKYFGEGITIIDDKLYQLTYKAGKCFVYNLSDLSEINSFTYNGEGWGLTNNDSLLIMSDGSYNIYFKDPETFETVKTIQVFSNRREFSNLNELEWINGYIYANIYTTNSIVKIDPSNGTVLEVYDCTELANDALEPGVDVLNGIAYNPITDKIYITGKNWSSIYEVHFSIAI